MNQYSNDQIHGAVIQGVEISLTLENGRWRAYIPYKTCFGSKAVKMTDLYDSRTLATLEAQRFLQSLTDQWHV